MKSLTKYGKPLFALAAASLCANAFSAESARAESSKAPEKTKVSNVVETQQLEPTAARINSLKLPAGFQIAKFAEMQNPRMIAVADDGTIYVSQRESGTLVMLKDTNNDGRADVQKIVATRKWMHGIALRGENLYFITIRELFVAKRKKDGTLGTPRLLIKDLPDAGQHPNRTIAFGPDGKLYISVGSTTNAAREPNAENATILVANADGTNRKIFASGLRNTIGFGWSPVSGRMYGWDHGIDELGDDVQREEFNEIKQGKRYGWPYIYENGKYNAHPVPPAAYSYADWARMSQNPVLTHTAHSAGIQMAFYTGKQFPAQYRNDAFIAARGSWNRNPPSGYELLRIRFDKAGKPVSIKPFLSSFLLPGAGTGGKYGHFGRLAGVAVAKDGAILLSDDTNNIVYRISYGAQNAKRLQTTAMDARKIAFDLPETQNARNSIVVRSGNFAPNGLIPFRHTAYDKNISPELRWSGVPKNAKSLVLLMEDPIGVNPKPFVHWSMINLAPTSTRLMGNFPETEKIMGAQQGVTSGAKIGYFGPKPPADGLAHKYHFQVLALDTRLDLPLGYNRQALIDAIRGHVIAKGQLIGMYKRN